MPAFTSLRSLSVVVAILGLAACSQHPPESAFLPRGGPDSLLDVSSEVVNLNVAQPGDRAALAQAIAKDQPTRAELYCMAGDPNCAATEALLNKHHVPVMMVPSGNNTVALVYERILAHDCNPRYLDPQDFYNANYPSFGCATAANTVQQVSNKQDFLNPPLSADPSAIGAVNAYHRAYAPPVAAANGASTSLISSGVSNSQ